jgi:chemotaxis protein CheD
MDERGLRLNEYYLKPGYIFLSRNPIVISAVLGSCVAVSLWDQKEGYGGMAHYLYPSAVAKEQATAQYGNAAIQYLARMFAEEGAKKGNLRAQIFGGASLPDRDCRKIAKENIDVARAVLDRLKIKIVSEDVGGDMGRKIVYHTANNEAVVYKSGKLRRGDWYPYDHSGR